MAKRTIKTIDDARLAMLELLPSGLDLFVDIAWHDSRARGHWYQTVRMNAAVWSDGQKLFGVTAPTAPDLYRNFSFALTQLLQPRRLASQPTRAMSVRAVLTPNGRAGFDEHDGVAASRERITTIEAKRICGPSS